eukprot:1260206-Prorocentrum_lima.AAC.1
MEGPRPTRGQGRGRWNPPRGGGQREEGEGRPAAKGFYQRVGSKPPFLSQIANPGFCMLDQRKSA